MFRLTTCLGLSLLLCSSLALGADAPPKKLKVAILPLKALGGAKQDIANIVTEQLAGGIQQQGFSVMSPDDLQARLGFERQKQLLGCTDESCLVEVGLALGVDRLVSGNVAVVGQSVVISLSLINNQTGAVDYRYSERVKQATDEAFLDLVPKAVAALFPPVGSTVERRAEAPAASTGRVIAWVTGGLAVAAVASGVVLFNVVNADSARIKAATDYQTALQIQNEGKPLLGAGIASFSVAGALAITSAILFATTGRPTTASVSFIPGVNGGSLVFGGSF